MSYITNMYHIACAANRSHAWHEWVPSDANYADIPWKFFVHSSHQHECNRQLFQFGVTKVPMVFPTPEQWDNHEILLDDLIAAHAPRPS